MSMVTLVMAAAMYTQYWGSENMAIAPATFVLLFCLIFMNACGVRVSGLHTQCGTLFIETSCMATSSGLSSGSKFVSSYLCV